MAFLVSLVRLSFLPAFHRVHLGSADVSTGVLHIKLSLSQFSKVTSLCDSEVDSSDSISAVKTTAWEISGSGAGLSLNGRIPGVSH